MGFLASTLLSTCGWGAMPWPGCPTLSSGPYRYGRSSTHPPTHPPLLWLGGYAMAWMSNPFIWTLQVNNNPPHPPTHLPVQHLIRTASSSSIFLA